MSANPTLTSDAQCEPVSPPCSADEFESQPVVQVGDKQQDVLPGCREYGQAAQDQEGGWGKAHTTLIGDKWAGGQGGAKEVMAVSGRRMAVGAFDG